MPYDPCEEVITKFKKKGKERKKEREGRIIRIRISDIHPFSEDVFQHGKYKQNSFQQVGKCKLPGSINCADTDSKTGKF